MTAPETPTPKPSTSEALHGQPAEADATTRGNAQRRAQREAKDEDSLSRQASDVVKSSGATTGEVEGEVETIGPYRVLMPIGEGGMGKVVLAHDPALDRKIAVKILPPEDADDEGRARFLREARALARIDHKNVVQVYASGVDGDIAWMALEYIEGDPLSDLLEGGPLDEVSALELASQIARGLAAVHAMGILHRDVKPSNLLLDDDGVVRVLDFGVALLQDLGGAGGFVTQKGIAVGTPHFMAPEQARGEKLDARVDSWGLGATLFTMLSGHPPFYSRDDESDLEILTRVLREPLKDIRALAPVTENTARLVERLLARDVEDRPEDLEELADILEDAADAASRGGEVAQPRASVLPPVLAPVLAPDLEPINASDVDGSGPNEETPASDAHSSKGSANVLGMRPLFALGVVVVLLGVGAFAIAIPSSVPLQKFFGIEGPRGNKGEGVDLKSSLELRRAEERILAETLAEIEKTASTTTNEKNEQGSEQPDQGAIATESVPLVVLYPSDARALGEIALAKDERRDMAIEKLLQMKGDDVDKTIRKLLSDKGAVAKATLGAVRRSPRADKASIFEWTVMRGPSAHQMEGLRALSDLRNVAAIEALGRAAKFHRAAAVRKAALEARKSLFSVEGEEL